MLPVGIFPAGVNLVAIDIDIIISVGVDIDATAATAPVAPPPESIGNTDTNSETNTSHYGGAKSVTIGTVIPRGVIWPPPCAVNHSRIVVRHIDNLGGSGFYNNDRLAG